MKDKKIADSFVPHAGEDVPGQPNWIIAQVFDWPMYWDITVVNKKSGCTGYDRIPKQILIF